MMTGAKPTKSIVWKWKKVMREMFYHNMTRRYVDGRRLTLTTHCFLFRKWTFQLEFHLGIHLSVKDVKVLFKSIVRKRKRRLWEYKKCSFLSPFAGVTTCCETLACRLNTSRNDRVPVLHRREQQWRRSTTGSISVTPWGGNECSCWVWTTKWKTV